MAQAAASAKKKKKVVVPTMYLWQGTNKQGRRVKGEVAGDSVQAVRADLRRQGLRPR